MKKTKNKNSRESCEKFKNFFQKFFSIKRSRQTELPAKSFSQNLRIHLNYLYMNSHSSKKSPKLVKMISYSKVF